MTNMDTFQQLWKNWLAAGALGAPDPSDHAWLYELNQAVFRALEKNLPDHVKVRTVTKPTFSYDARVAEGTETHVGVVSSYRLFLPESTFEERVDAALMQVTHLLVQSGAKTAFFYTPLYPVGEKNIDDTKNTRHMTVRLATTGETVHEEEGQ